MQMVIRNLLAELKTIEAMEAAQEWIHRVRDGLDVNQVVFHTMNHALGVQTGLVTWPKDWTLRYLTHDYVTIDPTVTRLASERAPRNWRSFDWTGKDASRLMQDAVAHGIGNQGWTMPIWGPKNEFSAFAVSKDASDPDWDAWIETNEYDLIVLGHAIDQNVVRILGDDRIPESPERLSQREREALTFLSLGIARSQAAPMMKISEATFRAHVDNAREKLRANDVTHAVARAIAIGALFPVLRLESNVAA